MNLRAAGEGSAELALDDGRGQGHEGSQYQPFRAAEDLTAQARAAGSPPRS
jgi:hypothetical protein